MHKRYVSIFSLTVLTALTLFNFQNCAPAAPEISGKSGPFDPAVRIVDDWSKTEIQFATESVQIQDEAESAIVGGLCNRTRNGAHLKWALQTDDLSVPALLSGEGSCQSGQFSFVVDHLENIVCGIPHRLVVEGDWGGFAVSQFEKRCQPLASEAMEAPASSPPGTECSLEYSPSSGQSNSCSQVCYRESKVVSSVTVDAGQCSSLVQKLASP